MTLRLHQQSHITTAPNEAALPAPSADVREPTEPPAAVHPRAFTTIVVFCVLALTAILYSGTLSYPMQFDDYMYLVRNPLVTNPEAFGPVSNLQAFVDAPRNAGYDPDLATNFFLRPLAYLTFRANWWLDGFNPRWFRGVNIVIHAINGLLLYSLTLGLLKDASKARKWEPAMGHYIASCAALLFIVHPLATESVTYVVQRFTSLGAMFYLAGLCAYFLALRRGGSVWRWALHGAAFVCLLAGMLTKECVFTAPIMAVVLDAVLLGTPILAAVKRAGHLLILLPVIPAGVLILGWARNDGSGSLDEAVHVTNRVDDPLNHWHFFLTQLTVIQCYLRKLLLPYDCNVDPEWPIYQSLWNWPVVQAVFLLGAMVAGSIWFFKRTRASLFGRLVLMGTVWFFGTVLISSGLVPLPDFMAEHRTYLPSIGLFMAAPAVIWMAVAKWVPVKRRLLVAWGAMSCVILTFAVMTVNRNYVWRSAIALWEDTAAKSPTKFRVLGNLGAALLNEGRPAEALVALKKSVELEPQFAAAHLNLSRAYNRMGRSRDALNTILNWEDISPPDAVSVEMVYEAAVAYMGLGKTDVALQLLNKIAVASPHFRQAQLMLGIAYTVDSQPSQALYHFERAAQLAPLEPSIMDWVRKSQQMQSRSAGM